jgi:hypothetical protein
LIFLRFISTNFSNKKMRATGALNSPKNRSLSVFSARRNQPANAATSQLTPQNNNPMPQPTSKRRNQPSDAAISQQMP